MQKPATALERWRESAPRQVAIEMIQTHEALQPRDESLVRPRDRARLADASAEQIARLHGVLNATTEAELDPLLLASIEGRLFVVDGHHRLKAYRRAKRETVPARVVETTLRDAAIVSKLVNMGGVKLPMHREQLADAAWQYLAHVTLKGSVKLPKGDSTRTVAGRFGISADTVHRMVHKLPEVSPEDYPGAAKDPGTGWPRWRHVKSSAWRGGLEQLEPAQVLQWRAEKCAAQIGKLKDKAGPEVFLKAVKLLIEGAVEGVEGATGAQLRQWAALDDDNGKEDF